jgi:hypothetical protein
MSTQEVHGLEKANEILRANTTPRARTLAELEREVEGTRFDHLPPWTSDKPIYEKRPCVIYHAVESSINSKKDLLLGEGRFPTITARPDEDESEDDEEDGLSKEQSLEVDKLICSVIREARLKPLFREMYASGQGSGTSVAICGTRRGRLFGETLPAKYATPTRDTDGNLTQVVIEYPYIQIQYVEQKWQAICYLYRRVIDAQTDVTFKPGIANIDGIAPKWSPAEGGTVVHGLGFVPVKWYKHDAPMQHVATEDGCAVHRNILTELHELDLSLSQRHHGALHALPQLVEIGVEPGFNPTASGSTGMSVQVTMNGGTPNPQTNPVRGAYKTESPGQKGARKKGPNHVYQYESPETKVQAINTPGDALKSIDDDVKDLRNKICETLAWVPLDPDSIKFAATVSGKALEILRERELNRVCQDRECFGEDVILGVVCMLLRIATVKAKELKTPRLKKCLPILKEFIADDGQWQDPLFTLKWPSFFVPSPEDEKFIVDMANTAYEGGSITRRTQVQAVSRIFGISNIDEYLESLEQEAEEKREREQEDMANSMAKFHDDPTGAGAGRSGKPKANPQGGAGGAGSAAGNPAKAKATQSA